MLDQAHDAPRARGWAPRADRGRRVPPAAARRESVDAITIAFGVRNLRPRPEALVELARVLRPGGTLAVLEATAPRARTGSRRFIAFHLRHVIPLAGRLSPDPSAYQYLSRSIFEFGSGPEFERDLEAAGFEVWPIAARSCWARPGSGLAGGGRKLAAAKLPRRPREIGIAGAPPRGASMAARRPGSRRAHAECAGGARRAQRNAPSGGRLGWPSGGRGGSFSGDFGRGSGGPDRRRLDARPRVPELALPLWQRRGLRRPACSADRRVRRAHGPTLLALRVLGPPPALRAQSARMAWRLRSLVGFHSSFRTTRDPVHAPKRIDSRISAGPLGPAGARSRPALIEHLLRAALLLTDSEGVAVLLCTGRQCERHVMLRGESRTASTPASTATGDFTRLLMRAGHPARVTDLASDGRFTPQEQLPGRRSGTGAVRSAAHARVRARLPRAAIASAALRCIRPPTCTPR